jgi:hypothetical protein
LDEARGKRRPLRQLTVRELEDVLQFPGNLQPMPGWLNSSKGSNLAEEWTSFPAAKGSTQRSAVSPAYTRSLTNSQNDMARQLQDKINNMIAARNRI